MARRWSSLLLGSSRGGDEEVLRLAVGTVKSECRGRWRLRKLLLSQEEASERSADSMVLICARQGCDSEDE